MPARHMPSRVCIATTGGFADKVVVVIVVLAMVSEWHHIVLSAGIQIMYCDFSRAAL
jgi:hypothetical protein